MHKLVYTDEQDLRIYESLPPTDFKEFFMAYFKYKKGDKVELTDFTNPVTFALFNSYIPKLDKNEDTYNKKVQASKENGKKGGRPKKSVITEVENNEFQIEQNTADLSPSNNEDIPTPQPIEEIPTEAIETSIEEEEFDNFSDELNDLLDEYEDVIDQLTNMIASANITNDVDIISTAKMAEVRIKNIAKQLINEIDKNNFYKYINEKVGIKIEKHKAA